MLQRFRLAALLCLLALTGLILATELWLAPIRPGGSWLALQALPLCAALPGLWQGRRYTCQWLSLLVWAYVCLGAVRAWSDSGLSAALGLAEALIAAGLFACCAAFARLSAPSRGMPKKPA